MATPVDQLDQLVATTFDKVKPVLADQITTKIALLAALNSKSKVTFDGGLTIRKPLVYAYNSTVGSYAGYDAIDTTPQGGLGYAEYEWRQQAASITISGIEVRKNSGSSQIINLLQAKIEQCMFSIENDMSGQVWGDGTGNAGKDFLGLQAIVLDTGTLGGIDSATETWWQSVVVPAVDISTVAGVAGLNNLYNSLHVNKSNPDFEFTDQASFEGYEALAADKLRFTDTKMAELGFEVITHKRAAVVFEPDVPAGEWYMINSNHLEFVRHPAAWLTRLPFQQPYNQDAKVALVISQGNLVTDVRRAHGKIEAVTT